MYFIYLYMNYMVCALETDNYRILILILTFEKQIITREYVSRRYKVL